MSLSSRSGSASAALRLALAAAVGIGLLLLWLTLRPGPENLAAPSKGNETGGAVSEELAALGDDPDGDGISTVDELRNGTNPLVADFPDVQILVEDIEFGLRVSATRSSSEKKLTAESSERQGSWHNAWTSGLEMSQTETNSMTAYTGRGGIGVANYAVPFGYVGQHVERSVSETTRSHSSFSFKREQLNTLKQQVQHQRENGQETRIEPNAGYFHGRVTVVSSHACCLEDFSVNVKVNGRLRWTIPASRDPNFKPLRLGTASGNGDAFLLRFDGLNTQEMQDHLINADEVVIAFEVPSTTIRLSEYAEAGKYSKTLAAIRSRCAQVEVVQAGKRASYYVSTVVGPSVSEIRLEDLLKRLPFTAPAVWGSGVAGDYLKNFNGRPGLDYLDPDSPADSMWNLSYDGEDLTGACRGRTIRPGGHVRLVHTSSRQYWGGTEDWKGYTACYQKLRDLQASEYRFWADLDGYDASAQRPWDALAQNNIREQALQLRDRYRAFLAQPVPPAVVAMFPLVQQSALQQSVGEFEKWFTAGGDLRFPTYSVRLSTGKIWWNINKELTKPTLTVTVYHNGVARELKSVSFEVDDQKQSGRFRFGTDANFEWSPFDAVVLNVRTGGANVVFVRYTAYNSLIGLLQKHDLAEVKAEPQLSGFQLSCDIRQGDREIPSHEFGASLEQSRPRVIPLVPGSVNPEIRAFQFWSLHHPPAYYQSGLIFEDLYRSEKAHPARYARLARAMMANFRAFRYQRCADLAGELPDDKAVTQEMLEYFPPSTTLADLRKLGAVAKEAAQLPRECSEIRLLRRVTLIGSSTFRLRYLVNDSLWRKELDTAEGRGWREALLVQLNRERAALAECASPTLREFLRQRVDLIDADLKKLGDQLR